MVIYPEIFDHNASYADAESCLTCITVCRAWKEAFTQWTSTLIRTHRRHINDLTVTNNSVLLASLDNNLSQLQCLKLKWRDVCRRPREFMDEKYTSNKSNIGDNGPITATTGALVARKEVGMVVHGLLWAFPALQSLDGYNQSSVDMVFSAEEERLLLSMGADEVYVIQELKLDTLDLGLLKTRGFLARMPFLVTLSIAQGAIAGAILVDVTRTFKHLQHLRFDLTRSCSREILVLLIESLGLKSFRGKGHTVLAHDLHLQALKNLWIFEPSWFKTATDEAVITAERQEGELAQIRQRLQQLGHEPTSNEIEALEQ
ncbi:hypothetical protein BKA57DRAFT_534106 [Linnemannia elongata]|nr:hypothetical protein BKA57DRAFT_534106 [Linnemannia elongata]